MPVKGYRKGQSDDREPYSKPISTHLTARQRVAFKADAAARPITEAKLLRSLITAHLTGRRAELPCVKGPSHARTRELSRIGNNLNQLTRQANAGIVPVTASELRAVLTAVLNAARHQ
jgi:hypothetical protein